MPWIVKGFNGGLPAGSFVALAATLHFLFFWGGTKALSPHARSLMIVSWVAAIALFLYVLSQKIR